jgi:dCTP deaminase
MILSDREIRIALKRGLLRIVPEPMAEGWSSTAVDLRIAAALRRWNPTPGKPTDGVDLRFRPAHPDFNFSQIAQQLTEEIMIPPAGYNLEPNQFILGWTLESTRIPNESRLAARVEGKSSLARLGLGIHVTAPTIHAGFGEANPDGIPLQLEIWNVGPLPIELQPEMRICQLIFEEVHGTPDRGYHGQFQEQGPGDSRHA